ncbi:MAG: mannose-1-phosphate guanylyltransferase [Rikenellaceae bacterium]|nr:mannose-1-phosphate guanylyltransferase [Rikenellaceae bacterium]
MNKNRFCVIMAGGIGSRFWPLSRTHRSKQFLDILGTGKTFIRQTFERFLPLIPVENFLVVTHANYKELVRTEIPEISEEQILLEPIGRNTAPCIAYAAYKLKMKNPGSSMVVTPSDHLVTNQHEFEKVIREGLEFAEQQHKLVTIGISPSRPDTGYGYIQIDSEQTGTLNRVKTFTEKPTLEVAEMFLVSGEFFWNSGIFIWRTEDIVKEFYQHLPEMNQLFSSVLQDYNTPHERQAIESIYPECRNISIDYGIMEKAENVFVRCADFGWSDIGTWNSLYQHAGHDREGNMISGDINLYDTRNTIIRIADGKLGVIQGLDDFIVVDTEDVLMICRREEEQNIRRFVEDVRLKKNGSFI